MSSELVPLYWVLWIGQSVAEAAWLKKKGWASWARALIFAGASNLLGFGVGFLLLFVWFLVMLALTWGDSQQRLPFKGKEVVALLVLVVLLVIILFALIKRALLSLMKIQRGGRAWAFSFLSSLMFSLLALGLTVLLAWLLFRNFSLN